MACRRRDADALRVWTGATTRVARVVGATAVVVLVGVSVAFAHARMVRSIPAKQAQLTVPPARVELWFNELLDDNFNVVEVFPAAQVMQKARTELARGEPVVDPQDRTHITIEVEPLPPGEYAVEYRVLSRDGHTAPGRFTFRVVAAR